MNIGFQRHTDLALSALAILAERDGPMAGADLADAVGTTITYLPQVMAPLVRERWVRSHRGPGGGYVLTLEARELTVRDVVDATQGSLVTGRCVLRDAPCPGSEECAIHAVWTAARTVLIEGLEALPAAQPAQSSRRT